MQVFIIRQYQLEGILAMILIACVALCPGRVFAGGGPENVLLVVNGDSPVSLQVANAIPTRVLEGTGINLIDDRFFPPHILPLQIRHARPRFSSC